jgi:hypothetical protein
MEPTYEISETANFPDGREETSHHSLAHHELKDYIMEAVDNFNSEVTSVIITITRN